MRWRKRMLEDLDKDIRDHLERETQDNTSAGCHRRKRAMRLCGNSQRDVGEGGDPGSVECGLA